MGTRGFIRPTTRSIMNSFSGGGILCFFASTSTVLLLACFFLACGRRCCVLMQRSTWCSSLCFIIFSAAPVFALPLVTIACALVIVGERGRSHVVIQLSCNSHAFSLHVERHVVSSRNNLHGFLHHDSPFSQQLLSFCCCLSPSLLQWWLHEKGETRQK